MHLSPAFSPGNLHAVFMQRVRSESILIGMKIKGPIVTLGAVAALGTGIFLANINQQPQQTAPAQPAAVTATASAPATVPPPAAPSTAAAVPFGPQEEFVADIPTRYGNMGLQISVTGDTAKAYACDNHGIETWLSGSSEDGALRLTSSDGTARLVGRHDGNAVVGNLAVGEKRWDFTASPGETNGI